MSMITWLHISDLHFHPKKGFNSDIVLKSLLEDITKRIQEDKLQPDFIILSGDIAFSSSPDEYLLAGQFLDKLLDITRLDKDRIFLVPGNHDVDRMKISKTASLIANGLNNRDAVNEVLDEDSGRTTLFQRFHNYENFIKEYMDGRLIFDCNNYYFVRVISTNGTRIAILGLNSAWLSASDKDKDKLLIGERQVRTALNDANDADIRLAVMHHPFDWLKDFDRKDVDPLLCNSCNFILHGHLHQSQWGQISTPDTTAIIIGAGACYETREYPNSYNFVQLDLSADKGKIYLRRYSDNQGGFWTSDTSIYRNAPTGV